MIASMSSVDRSLAASFSTTESTQMKSKNAIGSIRPPNHTRLQTHAPNASDQWHCVYACTVLRQPRAGQRLSPRFGGLLAMTSQPGPRQVQEAQVLRENLRLPHGHRRGGGLGRLAELRRLAPLGLVSFSLEPLRVNFAEVPQIAFDAAVFFEQLPTSRPHLSDDRVVLLLGFGSIGHGSTRLCRCVRRRSSAK